MGLSIDMEKVKKGLECCFATANCDGCPYEIECRRISFKTPENHCQILDDVLDLLKEHEPKPVELHTNAYGTKFYFCPKCKEPLSFRKKGKGPNAHRDHFSHRPDCECKGYTAHESESAIHKFAKESIFAILHNAIKEHQDFPISWTCHHCNQEFQGNLLQSGKLSQNTFIYVKSFA